MSAERKGLEEVRTETILFTNIMVITTPFLKIRSDSIRYVVSSIRYV